MRRRLKLGLIPRAGTDDKIAPLLEALGSVLGAPVDAYHAADYRVLVSSFEQKIVDVAWLPPLSMARAAQAGVAVPVAVAVRAGTTNYMSALISRADSHVRGLEDVVRLRAAWVDRESAAGYVVIRAALRDAGVRLVDAFAEDMFLRSHGEVARALRERRADVGATCINFLPGTTELARGGYEEGGLARDEVRILAYGGPIPSDAIAISRNIPPEQARALANAFVDGHPLRVRNLALALVRADAFARPDSEYIGLLEAIYNSTRNPFSIRAPQR